MTSECPASLGPRLVLEGDSVAEDHFTALPSGKRHDADRHYREAEAERHDSARSVAIALIKTEQLDEHKDDVADSVLLGISGRANASITEKIDQAGNSCQGCANQAAPINQSAPVAKA